MPDNDKQSERRTHQPQRLVELKLDSLNKVDDGLPAAMFNFELAEAIRDCQQRPLDTKARKVVLLADLVPEHDHSGALVGIKFTFSASRTIPKQVSRQYQGSAGRDGKVLFAPNSPQVVDQRSLLDGVKDPNENDEAIDDDSELSDDSI